MIDFKTRMNVIFEPYFNEELLILSTLLDPRFAFVDSILPEHKWERAMEKLKMEEGCSFATTIVKSIFISEFTSIYKYKV